MGCGIDFFEGLMVGLITGGLFAWLITFLLAIFNKAFFIQIYKGYHKNLLEQINLSKKINTKHNQKLKDTEKAIEEFHSQKRMGAK